MSVETLPPAAALPSLICAQCERDPEAVAVICGERSLTRRELEARATRTAHALLDHGLAPDQPVAVCMDRSLDVVVALYGIHKAGGAYVPLDPAYPEERLRLMLEDSQARIILHDATAPAGVLEAARKALDIDTAANGQTPGGGESALPIVGAENLAYIIYTSGSTGRPKGVEISHRAVCNLMRSMQRSPGFGADDAMLATSSLSFDLSVAEVFLPLVSGGRLVLAPAGVTRDGEALSSLIEASGASWMQATPTQLQLLLDAGWAGNPRLAVITGGEEVPSALAARLQPILRDVWVGYGPTETTVWSTLRRIETGETPVLVGGEVDNTILEVVDEVGRPVADGEVGELLIGGAGLARGYRFDEAKTDERFVFRALEGASDTPQRFYRTGDLFSRRPDGLLVFQGRSDHQVKVRGYRIEPGEIEAALRSHPAIRQAVVLAAGEGAARALVAGCEVVAGQAPSVAELRSHLLKSLPEYMLPAKYAFFEDFPLTPNQKIDRKAIAAEAWAAPVASGEAAPEGSTEAAVQGIVSELLGVSALGVEVDFFEAGGNSLLAGQVIARLRDRFGDAPGMKTFFARPTIRGLAEAVQQGGAGAGRFPVPIPSGSERREYPLSSAQERLWFMEKAHPGNMAYTFQCVLHFSGTLDVAALQRTLTTIVERHAVFRSTFHECGGRAVQVVHDPVPVSFPLVDLRDIPEMERAARARSLMQDFIARVFDLGRDFPVRWGLYRLSDECYQLLHHEHHLVHDGWSFRVFVGELVELYAAEVEGREARLAAPICQFGDFALAEAVWLESEEAARQLAFWRERLAPGLPPMELPYDRVRPPEQSLRGGSFRTKLSLETSRAARAFARREGVTLYTSLLAAFHVMLYRITGRSLVVTGCGIANRKSSVAEGLVGMFVNNVVYQNHLSADIGYRDLVHRVFDWMMEAQENSDVPFDRVVRAVGEEPGLSCNPLFQVMFNAHDAPVPETRMPLVDLRLEEVMRNGSAKFDLNVIVMPHSPALAAMGSEEDPDSISILWEFSSDLFDEATVRGLAEIYHQVVDAVLEREEAAISAIPLLQPQTADRVVREWNQTARDYPRDTPVHRLFEEQVARAPDRVALVSERDELNYGQLNARADAFAAQLATHHVAGTFVAIDVSRSIDFIVAALAILKAGAAYLPLASGNPEERNRWILENSGAHILVTKTSADEALRIVEIPRNDARKLPAFGADGALSPAYVMYTSGSTGRPKGVVVPHRAIVRLVKGQEYAPFDPEERFLLMAPVSFDASTFELWGALLNGASCAVFEEPWPEPAMFEAFVLRHDVTVMWLTAALFNEIVDSRPQVLRSVRSLLVGGEALSVRHVRQILEQYPHLCLVNGYGPTEGTTFSCTHRVVPSALETLSRIPIGRPIANTRCYILDPAGSPVPVGVSGELYIGGDGLALGYLNDEEKTAAAFVADPFPDGSGDRLYRTGDLCRWRPDGSIDFLGRLDDQVKIRGFRIEPGEIASVMKTHPFVRDAFVHAVRDDGGETRLVGYAVFAGEEPMDGEALRVFLRERLPDYMIPTGIGVLDKLPLTANGKVDRRRLPDVITSAPSPDEQASACEDGDIERLVAGVWADVLGIEKVPPNQSFFELGGHSLAAMRVLAQIADELGVRIRLAEFFRQPTVCSIAQLIETKLSDTDSDFLEPS